MFRDLIKTWESNQEPNQNDIHQLYYYVYTRKSNYSRWFKNTLQ